MEQYIVPLHAFLVKAGLAGSSEHSLVISITLFISLICACIVIGHLFEGNRWMNESTIALVLGCFAGFIVYVTTGGTSSHLLKFDEELFFIYLLPPIIFNAGFQVKKKQFFHNFGTIMLFGGAGVFVSAVIIAVGCKYLFPMLNLGDLQMKDYLAIGTIFSATDTVATLQVLHQDETPLLYSIVFGEGVVNDATSVVLFRAVQKIGNTELNGQTALNMMLDFAYLFSLSTVLGVVVGLLTAYIAKSLYFARHSTDRELSLMALMAYLSYMLAELFYLSGILSVFFCGILMSHYTWHNISESSKIAAKHAFQTMSFISETFMFLYVGTDVLNIDHWKLADHRAAFLISGILLVLIPLGRAAFVFLFSVMSNYVRGTTRARLGFRHQVVIWWAGLMRGAVSIALAYQQFTTSGDTTGSDYSTMICSTVGVVLFTTLVLGMSTKPLIERLLPYDMRLPPPSPKCHYSTLDGEPGEGEGEGGGVLRRRSSLSLLLSDPTSAVHSFWGSFDDLYMRPVFGGGGFVRDEAWEA